MLRKALLRYMHEIGAYSTEVPVYVSILYNIPIEYRNRHKMV